MDKISKNIITTTKGLGIIHYVSRKYAIIFADNNELILTELSHMEVKFGSYKTKKR